MPTRSGSALERALCRIEISDSGCWLWQGPLQRDGYSKVPVRHGQTAVGHRFFYEQLAGTIPAGLQLDHLCRTRRCVNPSHLEPVTVKENALRSESFAARHAQQTHCHRGHEFTDENTYLRRNAKGGLSRVCRQCRNEWNQAHRATA